jgi:hypothetical protein
MQSETGVRGNGIMRVEYVMLSLSILFSFLAFILTTYGIGIYGNVELIEMNPLSSFYLENNIGFIGFIINMIILVAVVKFLVMRIPDSHEKYRLLILGVLFGMCLFDFYYDAMGTISIMYLNT